MALDIGIKLNLEGYEGVMSDLRTLDGYVKAHKKEELTISLDKAKREVMAYRAEVAKLKAELSGKNKWLKKDGVLIKNKEWDTLNDKLKKAQDGFKRASLAASELSKAVADVNKQITAKDVYNKISTGMAHMGSAAQSLGNALVRFSSPFERLTSGFVMGAGYKLLGKATEGLESAFSRADTMRKYPRMMAEYSTKTYTAQQSVEDLDKSVQGLPIALDDAVSLAQRYTLSLGDMKRGTNLAIATNNAFLASMATESQRYQGMMQMQDLLNGKDLNSREWMSLGASMGKAINEIGKEMGYGKDQMGEFRQELYAGNIATEDFLNALEKVGTGNGSLVKLAQESMDTWEAFFSRIKTAFSRFGYGVITSLDELVGTVTQGKFTSLNSFLDDMLIPSIDNMTASVKDWIKAHPDEIIGFFKKFKDLNIGSLIKGFAEGLLAVADLYGRAAKLFGGKDLSWISKAMVLANPLGKALLIFGGLAKGLRPAGGLLGAGIFTVFSRFGRGGGLFGMVKKLFGGNKNPAQEIAEAPTMTSTLRRTLGSLEGLLTGAGAVLTAVGTAWLSVKGLKSIIKDFGEIGSLVGEVDWGASAKAMVGFAGFIAAFIELGGRYGGSMTLGKLEGIGIFGAVTAFATGIAALDMRFIKDTFKSFRDISVLLNEAIENFTNIANLTDVGDAVGRLINVVDAFNQITDVFKMEQINSTTGMSNGGLKKFSSESAESIKNITASLGDIRDAIPLINEINKLSVESGNIEANVDNIVSALGLVASMYDRLPESVKSGKSKATSETMLATVKNLKDSFGVFLGEGGLLAQIPQITTAIVGLVTDGALGNFEANMDALTEKLQSVFTKLTGAFVDIQPVTLKTKMEALANAMIEVRRVMWHINKMNGTEYNLDVSKISTLISDLKGKLNSDNINAVYEQVALFKDAVQTLIDAVSAVNGTAGKGLDIKIKLNTKIIGLTEALTAISQIQTKIKARIDSIKTYYSKNITVSLNVGGRVNKTNLDYSEGAIGKSFEQSGGIIYRAKGGSIFKPRGTDIVPAMLTPGEFVHSKKAVDLFGIDFMRRVNALDVRGAMKALMNRGGMAAASLNRQNVVNNTINNNQRVTQNINTNNPNMAKMSIGRFAGAF